MAITKTISSRSNVKQATGADFPLIPNQIVTNKYGPVAATSGQLTINLPFAVDQSAKINFILTIAGAVMSEGAANDYVFSNIQPNNTSSQITLSSGATLGQKIQAWYMGVAQPVQAANSIATLQASIASVFKSLTVQRFDSTSRTFTVTAANATVGATYTNNGQTFTVINTIAGGTSLNMTCTGAPTASGTLTKASGTGDATITFSSVTAAGSATYVPNPNLIAAVVEIQAGGGGGGASVGGASTISSGGGGGGGGYSKKTLTPSLIGASQALTIGAGGSLGQPGGANGGNGGSSSFGSILSAGGGSGGISDSLTRSTANTGITTSGGGGGSASGGDINIPGSVGKNGWIFGAQAQPGDGGASHLGIYNPAPSGSGTVAGSNGSGYGAGGSGAMSSTGNANGSTGAPGIVIITEYNSQ